MSDSCPCCGGELHWERDGEREKGFCSCNRRGPVIERDVLPTEPWRMLLDIPNVNNEIAQALCEKGLCSFDTIKQASDETLISVSGIGHARAAKIRGWLAEN